MLYALTINDGHKMFGKTCIEVLHNLILELQVTYADIVCHSNDHYHALISTETELIRNTATGSLFHFENVRNISAYVKYMHNHDVTDSVKMGELPYFETDSIIDYLESFGPVKTVQKYGFQALKNYRNLQEFYKDLKGGHS